mmetsp:Transcript_25506/g.55733  ORF Transcript_25506/g.55733 Transcript_25506/m.55733 type:complete len:211 (+) Transcript_25506:977-1609(+)
MRKKRRKQNAMEMCRRRARHLLVAKAAGALTGTAANAWSLVPTAVPPSAENRATSSRTTLPEVLFARPGPGSRMMMTGVVRRCRYLPTSMSTSTATIMSSPTMTMPRAQATAAAGATVAAGPTAATGPTAARAARRAASRLGVGNQLPVVLERASRKSLVGRRMAPATRPPALLLLLVHPSRLRWNRIPRRKRLILPKLKWYASNRSSKI